MWTFLKAWGAKTTIAQALGKVLAPPAPLEFREPFVSITDDDVKHVLMRCRTDLPPVAGLFWFAAEKLTGHDEVLTLIEQSPNDTDWWSLHTEKTVDGWMAQLPTTGANEGKPFRKVFESLYRCLDVHKVTAISALFSFLMQRGSQTAFPMAHLMLRQSPVPPFLNAAAMPVSEAFLPRRTRDQPLGAWIPMFKDDQGRTHDVLDASLLNLDRLEGTLGLVKEFAPIDVTEREGYLARQMALFSDVLRTDPRNPTGVPPRAQPDAAVLQSFLLAGAALPLGAWSRVVEKNPNRFLAWRPSLMEALTHKEAPIGGWANFSAVVQRLAAQGHDVLGQGPQAGPSAEESLMFFAQARSHDAVALMLRLGADPDGVVSTTQGPLSTRQFIATLNNDRMTHLLRTFQSRSAARSILDDIDDERPDLPALWQGFLTPSCKSSVLT